LTGTPGSDAADALGIAITHAHAGQVMAVLEKASPLARRSHAQFRKGRVY
jgi:crossover junction endodeoxyribonuclease RuvC